MELQVRQCIKKQMRVKTLLVILNHAIFPGFSRFFHYLGSIKLDFKSMQDICARRSVLMIRFAFNNYRLREKLAVCGGRRL